jgi:hypothetical protein
MSSNTKRKLFYKIKLFTIIFFSATAISFSQNFNYTLSKDSSAYVTLTNSTSIISNSSWINNNFTVHLPFTFNFCGTASDSIFIEGNGFIVFDKSKELAIVAFTEFSSNKDTSQNYSAFIEYAIEGSTNNRIVKIQYRNVSQNKLSEHDYLNYQIWLYENGNKVEFHIGSNSCSTRADSPAPSLLGLINKNRNSDNNAFLITGNAYNPTGQIISGEQDFNHLENIPSEGKILTLTPNY